MNLKFYTRLIYVSALLFPLLTDAGWLNRQRARGLRIAQGRDAATYSILQKYREEFRYMAPQRREELNERLWAINSSPEFKFGFVRRNRRNPLEGEFDQRPLFEHRKQLLKGGAVLINTPNGSTEVRLNHLIPHDAGSSVIDFAVNDFTIRSAEGEIQRRLGWLTHDKLTEENVHKFVSADLESVEGQLRTVWAISEKYQMIDRADSVADFVLSKARMISNATRYDDLYLVSSHQRLRQILTRWSRTGFDSRYDPFHWESGINP